MTNKVDSKGLEDSWDLDPTSQNVQFGLMAAGLEYQFHHAVVKLRSTSQNMAIRSTANLKRPA